LEKTVKKSMRWVPVNVPDFAMEIALIQSETEALEFLRGMLLGLTGRSDSSNSRGSQFGLKMHQSAMEWRHGQVRQSKEAARGSDA
jgi:hypothetical protein